MWRSYCRPARRSPLERRIAVLIVASAVAAAPLLAADTVGKWRRHTVDLPNASYAGNPFELEVDATFTHAGSGASHSLPGYYAGDDTWRFAFMPTAVGDWSFVTSSSDPDLDGVSGVLTAVESGHPGLLAGDPQETRKWRFADGHYVVPIGLLFNVFLEETDEATFSAAADFLADEVQGHLFNFRLTNLVFAGDWHDHQFDLALWDRLDERMEVLTDRGLGASVMLYTDDGGKPPWEGQSATEELLIRYAVARLASFPSVLFNTGIDISEYRDQAWVDWYGERVRELDPYSHPVSSRHGGGSGNLVMAEQLYDSRGAKFAEIDELTEFFAEAAVPVGVDDNWGEQYRSRGNFSPGDIRRAFWKCTLAGGVASHIRDDTGTDQFPDADDGDAYFHAATMAEKLESEQWLRWINPFVRESLGSIFAEMEPEPSLVSNGYCLADAERIKMLYWVPGVDDQFDPGDGGDLSLQLTTLDGRYSAAWLDPRSGSETPIDRLDGGVDHVLTPPTDEDWVLLLSEPRLSAEGSCPGSFDLSLRGVRSGEPVAIAWSDSLGATAVPVGRCAGTPLDLASARLLTVVRADERGESATVRQIGGASCGRYLQAIGLDSCWVSSVVQIVPE